MDENESLSHSKWKCKYPLYLSRSAAAGPLYKALKKHLGEIFRRLTSQKESRILEGHLMADHVQC